MENIHIMADSVVLSIKIIIEIIIGMSVEGTTLLAMIRIVSIY